MRHLIMGLITTVLLSGCTLPVLDHANADGVLDVFTDESMLTPSPATSLPRETPTPLLTPRESPMPLPSPSKPPTLLPTPQPAPKESPAPKPAPPAENLADEMFVVVLDYIPDIVIDLKYATDDNFTATVIYDFTIAYLRFGTVKKLRAVQEELKEQGLGLKIWDAFRPVAAQFVLWETVSDPRFVANPNTGYSNHSRGNTVDITLVDANGNELEMPTAFDEFTALASRDYSNVPEPAAGNALLLQNLMYEHGFRGASSEWWHYTDKESYPVEREFRPTD